MLQYVSRGATLFIQSFVKSRLFRFQFSFFAFSVFSLLLFFFPRFSRKKNKKKTGEAAQFVGAAGRSSYTMSVML